MGITVQIYNGRLGQNPGVGLGNTVTIHAVKLEDKWKNKFLGIPYPRSKQRWSDGRLYYFVDLLRITRTITIIGHITANDNETIEEVLSDLMAIYQGGGSCYLTVSGWPESPLEVMFEALEIATEPTDEPAELDKDVTKYRVTINCVVGTHK